MVLNGEENPHRMSLSGFPACIMRGGNISAALRLIRPAPGTDRAPLNSPGGFVDKRKSWREQEQSLVARWNDAVERQRQLQRELSRQPDESAGELKQKELAVRSEIEGLRREVARLKVQFNSGKRY